MSRAAHPRHDGCLRTLEGQLLAHRGIQRTLYQTI